MKSNPFSMKGKLLIAMPGMGDLRFEKSLIYVCAHSEEGAMGFIVNRAIESPRIENFLTQLNIITEEEREVYSDAIGGVSLFDGGPVEPGRGFVLHSSDYTSNATMQIDEDISLTATLEILRAIATGRGPKNYMIALGYAGWACGQLEEEISSNGWLTTTTDLPLLFDAPLERRYDMALGKLGVTPSLLSADAGHA